MSLQAEFSKKSSISISFSFFVGYEVYCEWNINLDFSMYDLLTIWFLDLKVNY